MSEISAGYFRNKKHIIKGKKILMCRWEKVIHHIRQSIDYTKNRRRHINGIRCRNVNIYKIYKVSRHKHPNNTSLVNRRVNGGIARNDIRLILDLFTNYNDSQYR